MAKSISIFLLALLLVSVSNSQELDFKILENILEKISLETGSSPEIENIEQLIENPLYLKTASIQDFLKIPGFTTSEAKQILLFSRADSTISFSQLFQKIELTEEQKYLLNICTSLDKTIPDKKAFWRTRLKDYLIEPRGFTQKKFKGDKLDIYNRISGYIKDFNFGFLTDKDAGELHLADNYSAYLSGIVYDFKVLAGDYYLETGMGNILWKTFPANKGAEVIYPVIQKGSGIREYRSSIDYKNFRGFAIQRDLKIFNNNLNIIVWYSNSNRAGTYDSTKDIITSVYRSGYYRTESEIQKKNAFNEVIYGGNIEWSSDLITLGFIALHINNDKELVTESKALFLGKAGNLLSAYTFINYGDFSLGTELSRDAKGNTAFKAGSQFEVNTLEIALAGRSFTPGFRSPYGMMFGESSIPNNEYGFYTGLRYKGISNILLSAYSDFYSTYERTYTVPEPIHGSDLFFQTDWTISKNNKLVLRFVSENKTDVITDSYNEKEIYQKQIFRARTEFASKLFKTLSLRFRIEACRIDYQDYAQDETGIAGFIESIFSPKEFIQIGGRFSAFTSKNFESVIYQFELALPGYMTTQPLYGDGFRSFLFAKISPLQNIDFWIRYSILKKNNVTSIGSNYLEIWGNRDERLILQLDISI